MTGIILDTARLTLRPLAPDDAPLLGRYSREPAAREELPDEVCETEADAAELIGFLAGCWQKDQYPLVLGIAEKAGGTLIGHVGLSEIPDGIEIGYAVAEAFQRRGYAAEAAAALTRWALDCLRLPRVYGIVKQGNLASASVLRRAGYRLLVTEEAEAFGGRCVVSRYVCEPKTQAVPAQARQRA